MDIENATQIEVDELLEKYAGYRSEIAAAEQKRDDFISHYQAKIDKARDICESECKAAKIEMALIEEQLKRYAQTQVTDKRRSVKLPSGTLSFRKQNPRFFFDDLKEADGKNERLIDFVKHNAHEYLRVKVAEAVDWKKFKGKLQVDDGGEVFSNFAIYSSSAQTKPLIRKCVSLPDKFLLSCVTSCPSSSMIFNHADFSLIVCARV